MKELIVCNGDVALVDSDIYELVCDDHWHFDGARVYRAHKGKTESLHRFIMGVSKTNPLLIDHIDRSPLNNLRSNLRLATHKQNSYNTAPRSTAGKSSQYKGVTKVRNKYRAAIQFDGKKIQIGYFHTEHEAALAYNLKAQELFGEYAYLNQVDGES